MSEKIFVALAWPYANGQLHVGHMAGVFLPADIFARYHRLKGSEVLMLRPPAPLFQKLEESVIEEEGERLRRQAQAGDTDAKKNGF
jgi:hypothetical protein